MKVLLLLKLTNREEASLAANNRAGENRPTKDKEQYE
jgi:hypothetical protein